MLLKANIDVLFEKVLNKDIIFLLRLTNMGNESCSSDDNERFEQEEWKRQ